jgi:hypothetical protein
VIHSGDITGAAALLSLHQRFGCTRRKKASRFGVGSLLSVGLNWTVDTRGQGKLCFACTGSPPPRAGLASPSAGAGIPSAKTLNRHLSKPRKKKNQPPPLVRQRWSTTARWRRRSPPTPTPPMRMPQRTTGLRAMTSRSRQRGPTLIPRQPRPPPLKPQKRHR